MLIKCCKKNDSLSAESLIVLGLVHSPFMLTKHISTFLVTNIHLTYISDFVYWRASEVCELSPSSMENAICVYI